MAPVGKAHPGLGGEQARQGAAADAGEFGPPFQRFRPAGFGQERVAHRAQASVAGQGQMQRLRFERADLFQDQRRDVPEPALGVVVERRLDDFEDQRAQQSRHQDHLAAVAERRRGIGVDVKPAHRDRARHPDRMFDAGRYPQRPLRRHHPGVMGRRDRHHARHRPGQLRARMGVRRDGGSLCEILRHPGDRPRRVLIIRRVRALHVRFSTITVRTLRIGRR